MQLLVDDAGCGFVVNAHAYSWAVSGGMELLDHGVCAHFQWTLPEETSFVVATWNPFQVMHWIHTIFPQMGPYLLPLPPSPKWSRVIQRLIFLIKKFKAQGFPGSCGSGNSLLRSLFIHGQRLAFIIHRTMLLRIEPRQESTYRIQTSPQSPILLTCEARRAM